MCLALPASTYFRPGIVRTHRFCVSNTLKLHARLFANRLFFQLCNEQSVAVAELASETMEALYALDSCLVGALLMGISGSDPQTAERNQSPSTERHRVHGCRGTAAPTARESRDMWLAVISDPRIVASCTPDRGTTSAAPASSSSRAAAATSSPPCNVPGAEKFLIVYRQDRVLLERVAAVLDSVHGRTEEADNTRSQPETGAHQAATFDMPPIKIGEKWLRNLSNWSRV